MTDTERSQRTTELMTRYGTDIKRFCLLQLRDASQAEDAAQDVFIKAWRALSTFRGDSSEKTWLLHIAANTCRDYQRTGWFRFMDRRVTPEDMERGIAFEFPDDSLSKAITELPPLLRQAVTLRYFEELSIRQMTQVLGVSEATAKRRIRKANVLLRQSLKEWYEDEED